MKSRKEHKKGDQTIRTDSEAMWKFYFRSVPEEIKEDYRREVIRSNGAVLSVLSVLAICAELFNIARVLFFSKSGLGTQNNRIYFTFYLVLLTASVLFLIIKRCLGNHINAIYIFLLAAAGFFIVWSLLLNYYDFTHADEPVYSIVYITSLLAMVICLYMEPVVCLGLVLGSGIPFLLLTKSDFGFIQNTLFSMGTAALVSFSRFQYKIKTLMGQKKIQEMNRRLTIEMERKEVAIQKLRYIIEQSNYIIVDWDKEEDRAFFYGHWTEKFDYPAEISSFTEWVTHSGLLSRKEWKRLQLEIIRCMKSTYQMETEIELSSRKGVREFYLFHLSVQHDSAGEIRGVLGYLSDIHKQKEEIQSLKSRMDLDPLTGLLNRTAVKEKAQEWYEGDSGNFVRAMIMLDLDDFKAINDTYGHPCGDQVLMEVANLLRRIFRETDALSRIGGDEFVVLMKNVRNVEDVERKLKKLSRGGTTLWNGARIPVKFSIGAAVSENGEYEELYRLADEALYDAKYRKKGSYVIMDERAPSK